MAQHICNSPGFPCVEIDQHVLDKHIPSIVGGAVRVCNLGYYDEVGYENSVADLYTERFGSGEGIGLYTSRMSRMGGIFHMMATDETVAAVRALAN